MIIIGGRNISPEDVEGTVQAASRHIRMSSVAAVGVDDGVAETCVIIAELQMPRLPEEQIKTEVIAPVIAALSATLRIPASSFCLVPPGTIKRTSSGKIRRGALRDEFLASSSKLFIGLISKHLLKRQNPRPKVPWSCVLRTKPGLGSSPKSPAD